MTEPGLPGASGAKHLLSRLTAESLQSRELLRATDSQQVRRLLPKLIVLKLGGATIIDRGPEALLPVVDQLAELMPDHQLLLCTGEGARARHAYAIATDLGLPVGMLSMLGNSAADQNARIVTSLLMDHGALHVPISLVPTLATVGGMLIISGMPPYEWWEPPVTPGHGRIPEYRSDSGTFLIAEALGAERVIYVKDVDGVRERDPASHDDAPAVGDLAASELLARGYDTLPFEPVMVEMLSRARVVKRVQLIDGLTAGSVLAAVRGEAVGSVVTAG